MTTEEEEEESFVAILEQIRKNDKSINRVRITGLVGDLKIMELGEAMKSNDTIVHVELLNYDGAALDDIIFAAMAWNDLFSRSTQLTGLAVISPNKNLRPKESEAILVGILKHMKSLEYLFLSGMNANVKINGDNMLSKILENNRRSLKRCYLNNLRLVDSSIRPITYALYDAPNLEHASFNRNLFRTEGMMWVLGLLDYGNSNITMLDIGGNAISDVALLTLTRSIQKHSAIQELNISGGKMGIESSEILKEFFSRGENRLKRIDLSRNPGISIELIFKGIHKSSLDLVKAVRCNVSNIVKRDFAAGKYPNLKFLII